VVHPKIKIFFLLSKKAHRSLNRTFSKNRMKDWSLTGALEFPTFIKSWTSWRNTTPIISRNWLSSLGSGGYKPWWIPTLHLKNPKKPTVFQFWTKRGRCTPPGTSPPPLKWRAAHREENRIGFEPRVPNGSSGSTWRARLVPLAQAAHTRTTHSASATPWPGVAAHLMGR